MHAAHAYNLGLSVAYCRLLANCQPLMPTALKACIDGDLLLQLKAQQLAHTVGIRDPIAKQQAMQVSHNGLDSCI